MKLQLIAAAVAVLAAGTAHAEIFTFDRLLTGASTAPASVGGTLITAASGTNLTFTLTVPSLTSFSSTGTAFVGALAVGGTSLLNIGSTTNVVGGVTQINITPANGPLGLFDLHFNFGQGSGDRLVGNETLSWTWVGGADEPINGFALHIRGIGATGNDSAWYGASVVPEPSTYALFAAGLLAVVGASRRRKAG